MPLTLLRITATSPAADETSWSARCGSVGWSAAPFRVDICEDGGLIRLLSALVPATVHTSGPPWVAIAVPIVVAVAVAFWVARRRSL